VAYHALKNRADAEDVMQTTLLRLLEHEGVELSRLSVPKRGTAL